MVISEGSGEDVEGSEDSMVAEYMRVQLMTKDWQIVDLDQMLEMRLAIDESMTIMSSLSNCHIEIGVDRLALRENTVSPTSHLTDNSRTRSPHMVVHRRVETIIAGRATYITGPILGSPMAAFQSPTGDG